MSTWIPRELEVLEHSETAEAEALPIAAPPCTGCKHWEPRRVYGTYTITRGQLQSMDPKGDYSDWEPGGRFFDGFRLCHAEDQSRDFSCFRPRGG